MSSFSVLRGCPARWYDLGTTLFLPQPRPQDPPREKLPTKDRHSSGASYAEGPGDEVVSTFPSSPLQAAYSPIGLMTHFPLRNFFFSHFPYGAMFFLPSLSPLL